MKRQGLMTAKVSDTSRMLEKYRPVLYSIAYRMICEVETAKDMVQETIASFLRQDHTKIEFPKAYLSKILTNHCINYLNRVSLERKYYKGTWLPEPFIDETGEFEIRSEIPFAMLLLLEKLTPVERSLFILKDAFNFNYRELSSILEMSEEACRQALHRAKKKLKLPKKRRTATRGQQAALLAVFIKACQTGDTSVLINHLKDDITVYGDGGGKAVAISQPISGNAEVIQFLKVLVGNSKDRYRIREVVINGTAGLVSYGLHSVIPDTVMVMEIDDGLIGCLYFIRNPDKIMNFVLHQGMTG